MDKLVTIGILCLSLILAYATVGTYSRLGSILEYLKLMEAKKDQDRLNGR